MSSASNETWFCFDDNLLKTDGSDIDECETGSEVDSGPSVGPKGSRYPRISVFHFIEM